MAAAVRPRSKRFLSTPSARRATRAAAAQQAGKFISIHALREEGDLHRGGESRNGGISIHALREEGDLGQIYDQNELKQFLSTPSARRATW